MLEDAEIFSLGQMVAGEAFSPWRGAALTMVGHFVVEGRAVAPALVLLEVMQMVAAPRWGQRPASIGVPDR